LVYFLFAVRHGVVDDLPRKVLHAVVPRGGRVHRVRFRIQIRERWCHWLVLISPTSSPSLLFPSSPSIFSFHFSAYRILMALMNRSRTTNVYPIECEFGDNVQKKTRGWNIQVSDWLKHCLSLSLSLSLSSYLIFLSIFELSLSSFSFFFCWLDVFLADVYMRLMPEDCKGSPPLYVTLVTYGVSAIWHVWSTIHPLHTLTLLLSIVILKTLNCFALSRFFA
jgi:hypothetical protein